MNERKLKIAHADIMHERLRQEQLKAEGRFDFTCADNIADGDKLVILTEEIGEVARAIHQNQPTEELYDELIQNAAISLAWAESLVELAD